MSRRQEIPQAGVAAQARHERGSVKLQLRTVLDDKQQTAHPEPAQSYST